jgi:hypothetical protein
MKIILPFLSFLLITSLSFSQKITGKLKFEQGQKLEISMQVKTTISQQAMGQAIDFKVDASGVHSYLVTNATEDNTTLNHQVKQISFAFDGMGQKRNFDSNNEKDINGQFGKPIKEILEKKFDMIIDSNGKALMVLPEKIVLSESDSRMAIITGMMKDVIDLVQPPQKGKGSFFKVLPNQVLEKGSAWTDSYINENGKFDEAYSISDITDTTIIVDFIVNSLTVSKAEMMGNITTTSMNNKSSGKIILDRATGIIKEKTSNTESNGSTEAPFGTLPVNSKTSSIISVKPIF